ncbi:MAG: acyltransferase family protein [Acholeplasmatales bacterium]|nr:acyltransferase family protein [Acholeplasmatales bacterium]
MNVALRASNNRKSNIELLRIIAIIFIIAHHLAVHGFHLLHPDIYNNLDNGSKVFIELLMPGGAIGVSIFFIICGYFKINKDKISLKKVLLEAIFYGLLIVLLFVILKLCNVEYPKEPAISNAKQLLTAIFNPVTSNAWWFLTSYIFLILLSPVINIVFSKVDLKGYIILFLMIYLLIFTIDLIMESKYFSITRGILFYLIGGFIFRFFNTSNKLIIKRIISIILFITSWVFISYLSYNFYNKSIVFDSKNIEILYRDLMNYLENGILVVIAATSIFIFFISFNFNNKIINLLAKTTFGIYLLHDNYIIRNILWNLLITNNNINIMPLIVYSFISIISIFVICMIIDLIRILLVEDKYIKLTDRIINSFKNKHYKKEENENNQ